MVTFIQFALVEHTTCFFLFLCEFIFALSILFSHLIFIIFFYYKIKNKDKDSLLVLSFFKTKRTLWKKIKLFYLFVFLLVPNKIYVYNGASTLIVFISTLIIVFLGGISPFFYILFVLKMYFSLTSALFGSLYEGIPTFRNKINKIYFSGEQEDAKTIFNYFYGNMFSRGIRHTFTGLSGSGAIYWKRKDEAHWAQHEAERRINFNHTESGESLSTPQVNSYVAAEKQNILFEECAVHGIQHQGYLQLTKAINYFL